MRVIRLAQLIFYDILELTCYLNTIEVILLEINVNITPISAKKRTPEPLRRTPTNAESRANCKWYPFVSLLKPSLHVMLLL